MANQGAICGPSSVAPALQLPEENRGYSTHITVVPFAVILKMCMLLDVEREIDGNDYRMLGSELGCEHLQILCAFDASFFSHAKFWNTCASHSHTDENGKT